MQFTTTAIIALASALLSTAAPTGTEALVPRACSTAYPQAIGFPINYKVSQDANGANKQDAYISFSNIPAGSYGCTLRVDFPAGYTINSSGASQVNFVSVDGAAPGSIFGTTTFSSPQIAVINSATCSNVMTYKMTIASQSQAGSVAFADVQNAGITMTYNC